jgi:hypothetical protein
MGSFHPSSSAGIVEEDSAAAAEEREETLRELDRWPDKPTVCFISRVETVFITFNAHCVFLTLPPAPPPSLSFSTLRGVYSCIHQ